jgi:hypothetical protein
MGETKEQEEEPTLKAEDLKTELRGYEVGRLVTEYKPGGVAVERWAETGKFRPNRYGWNEARKMAVWLQEKHPNETYRVRVVVSLEPPAREDTGPTPELPGVPANEESGFAGIDRTVAPPETVRWDDK